MYRQEADDQVYGILEKANAKVTGNATVFDIDRPVDTLRARLLASGTTGEPVPLSLLNALDVAAENSFNFQRQKESLYLAALSLTREQHDFALRWSGGGSAEIDGGEDLLGNNQADVDFSGDLSAAITTIAGTRIVASFVNTLMRSIISGDGFNGSSILSLTLTQPLLRGAGVAIVREPLTQAERNVVYAVRSFEQFRRAEAVRIVSDYYGIIQDMRNLDNVRADLESRIANYERADALFNAGRGELNDVDQAEQNRLAADNRLINTMAGLDTSLDTSSRSWDTAGRSRRSIRERCASPESRRQRLAEPTSCSTTAVGPRLSSCRTTSRSPSCRCEWSSSIGEGVNRRPTSRKR